jgi:hypothetical protein
MSEQQEQPPVTEPAGQPGTSEASQWAAHPFTGSLAEARTRIEEVAGQAAARKHGVRAAPEVIDAAVITLAVPPDRRDVSVTVHPATVWDIEGYKVLVWDAGPPGEPAPYAECSCGHWDGPCEHLLVALAGTEACR